MADRLGRLPPDALKKLPADKEQLTKLLSYHAVERGKTSVPAGRGLTAGRKYPQITLKATNHITPGKTCRLGYGDYVSKHVPYV
ncbi:hypothetical protein ABT352_26120 [Streptosporangium sp. NPDC000563]|uniref:hypothetical protein n=1 Tax=Streptosporangium sp. NPDC000563 TaxID=3154366 RepID=UPI00332B0F62